MATERQIRANRANARFSTGPKTLAGKFNSSRNAYRHGLSGPVRLDTLDLIKAAAIALVLAGEQVGEKRLTSAAEVARTQLELQRIRVIRAHMMKEVDLSTTNTLKLKRILALDRYERYCLAVRKKAFLML